VIPAFTKNGLLPPVAEGSAGHETDIEELRNSVLGQGSRRRGLIDELEGLLARMASYGVRRVYVNGSFITDRPAPRCIKACYDSEGVTDVEALRSITNNARTNRRYKVDFLRSYSGGHPWLETFRVHLESGREQGPLVINL
jgi:hypothetical protein